MFPAVPDEAFSVAITDGNKGGRGACGTWFNYDPRIQRHFGRRDSYLTGNSRRLWWRAKPAATATIHLTAQARWRYSTWLCGCDNNDLYSIAALHQGGIPLW